MTKPKATLRSAIVISLSLGLLYCFYELGIIKSELSYHSSRLEILGVDCRSSRSRSNRHDTGPVQDELPLFESPIRTSSNQAFEDVDEDVQLGHAHLPTDLTYDTPHKPTTPACHELPGAEDVLVVVKTGATEAFARVPEQLLTMSRCIPNFMIFSDLEQDIGDFHIYDALDEVSDEYKNNNEDFELYHTLRKYHAEHGDVSLLDSGKGWDLDKWKNIPMLHKAYQRYPDTQWFVFIDADAYIGWTNLLQLLSRLDSTEPLYFGTIYSHGDTKFAQGGTGYVVSKAAVEKFEEIHDEAHIAAWEYETSTICCGDVMLSIALHDAGVNVSGAWPLLQSDPPSMLDWSDRVWCTPAVSWHHVHAFEVEALWHFEQTWINQTKNSGSAEQIPYLYKDAFEYFVQPYISATRNDWNNLSRDRTFTEPTEDHPKEDNDWDWLSDEEKQSMWDDWSDLQRKSVESAEDCYAACEADEGCMQYLFRPGSCNLNWAIRLGHATEPDNDIVSGWMLDRLEQFKQSQTDCDPVWDLD